jgi:hypothetical protein
MEIKAASDEYSVEDMTSTEDQFQECIDGITALEQQLDELTEEKERLVIADDEEDEGNDNVFEEEASLPVPPRRRKPGGPPPPRPASRVMFAGTAAPPNPLQPTDAIGNASSMRVDHTFAAVDKQARILEELISTELSHATDLRLVEATYLLDPELEQHGIDKAKLFGNIAEIAAFAEKMHALLVAEQAKPVEEQCVGQLFVDVAVEVETVYVGYCVNYDEANTLLNSEYQENETKKAYLAGRQRRLSAKSNSWDLNASLIKPVQRIMKYPMLLKELQRSTAPLHSDLAQIGVAAEKMGAVAMLINERKRTKELVARYTGAGGGAAPSSGGGLMHALSKKGGRIQERMRAQLFRRSTIEEGATADDENHTYIANVKKVHALDATAKTMDKCISKHADHLKASAKCFSDVGAKLVAVYDKDSLSDKADVVRVSLAGVHAATEAYCTSLKFIVHEPLKGFHSVFARCSLCYSFLWTELLALEDRQNFPACFTRSQRRYMFQ